MIEALGGGHLPAAMLPAVDEAVAGMPVVLSSRTHAGEALRATYGFPSAEVDLLSRGLLSSGWLEARKARVLLSLLLGDRQETNAMRDRFARYITDAAPA